MNNHQCPRCLHRLKNWHELTEDQKFLVERLPASAEFAPAQRKKHRFCERCWFEDYNIEPEIV